MAVAEEDLRTFIRDITRRNERVFQEHLKQWERLHARNDRFDASLNRLDASLNRIDASLQATAKQLADLAEESRAQRAGLFKLIDAIRDLEQGLGGSAA